MDRTHSFGYWVRRRRKALDLSQRELAERAACSLSAIKKIEQDTRRPSRQLAESLAIPENERERFLRSARGLIAVDKIPLATQPLELVVEAADQVQTVEQGNLPVASTPILGRDVELERIIEHIFNDNTPLVTLTGPGGVGKSRLALEAAKQAQASFQDGAWFVPLTGVDEPAYLTTAIAVAQGLNFAGPLDPEQQLIRQLHDRHLLLLLDNFEQLLPEGVELIFSLIQSLSHIKMLVTSRERLRLQAEVTVPVGGLPLEPARTLFVERAKRTGADLTPEQIGDTAASINEICLLVGGLPLAIELAAAWTRLLPPAEILSDLEQNFNLLKGDQRDLPERHRSMKAVFIASWKRLPPEEQKLLAGMSVFAGSFSRDAAESICGATLSQLAMLHDHSLVEHDKERFRLHELVHQFAAEKLADNPNERDAVKSRHAAYYISFLSRLSGLFKVRGSQLTGWEQAIEREMDNIHVAWGWIIMNGQPQQLLPTTMALAHYLDIRGQVREGSQMFAALGQSAMKARAERSGNDAVLRRTQAIALALQGSQHMRMGDFEQGPKEIRQAVSLLEDLDAPDERIVILPQVSLVNMLTGDFVSAQRVIEEALALARSEDHVWGHAVAFNFLGILNLLQGRPEEARDYLSESVTWWSEQADLIYGKARSLVHLGLAHHASGDYKRAQSIQEEALKLTQELQDYSFAPLSQCNLAFHHYALGKLELAKAGFRTGLGEALRFDLFNSVWHSILGLGLAAAAEGLAGRAVTLLTFGLDRPGGYNGLLLGEPMRILAELRGNLPPADFAAAEEQARAMDLADLMAWLSSQGLNQ